MCCSRRCRALRLPGTLQGQGRILIMLVLRRTAPRLQRGWWRTPRMAFMAMRSPLRHGQYRIYAKHLRESGLHRRSPASVDTCASWVGGAAYLVVNLSTGAMARQR